MTLLARLLANGVTGLQPASQRAGCGSGQSLSYVDPEKRKHKVLDDFPFAKPLPQTAVVQS